MLVTDPETGLVMLSTEPSKAQQNWKPPTNRKGDRLGLVIRRKGDYVRFKSIGQQH